MKFLPPSHIPLLILLLCAAAALPAHAQISVKLQAEKREFVAYEPIRMQVSITNLSANPILLSTPDGGRSGWLRVEATNDRGDMIHPGSTAQSMDPLQIRPNQTIQMAFDLGTVLPVTNFGAYSVNASVWSAPDRAYSRSNSVRITVVSARKLWSQPFGVPHGQEGGGTSRIYSILRHRGMEGGDTLYFRLDDRATGRVLACYPVGRTLDARDPMMGVDSQARLHLLYVSTPDLYRHLVFDPAGSVIENRLYREVRGSRPRLADLGDGMLIVNGGVPHNPEAEMQARQNIRRLSERPPGMASPAARPSPNDAPAPANPRSLPQLDPNYAPLDR